ncbi:MAG: hypothetical protein NTX54_12460 [Chloroflexi bacterium]|nr:hypothetical protein [Chloroflexota bacterium]
MSTEVQVGEMVPYATGLRCHAGPTHTFTITFDHYEKVPGIVSNKVTEDAK